MADKITITMYPPGGGDPVEVQPAQVETMTRRGWLESPTKKKGKKEAAVNPE